MRFRIIIIAIGAAATWFFVSNTFSKGLSLADMDWDDSGQTSLMELSATIDYGVRPSADQPACREVFEFKDGRPIKLLCP